jgi:hypothetical protein
MDQIYLPTGNERISIPTLFTDGSIESINFISMRHRGLIEMIGNKEMSKPFIRPILSINGEQFKGKLEWERESYWIPKFQAEDNGIKWSGEISAPIGERGFYYLLEAENKGKQSVSLQMGLEGCWAQTLNSINESKEVRAQPSVIESGWNNSILFELLGETPLFAFAPMTDQELDIVEWDQKIENDEITYQLLKNLELGTGEKVSICFYYGLGMEEVGAATSAKEILRKGWQSVRKSSVDWLNKRIRTTGDQQLDEVMNLNLFFNFFYATGQTLDTEEDVLVTSRSPRYYVSAAYWDRDSLLWSFPSILVTDTKRAKGMLEYVFTTQRRNIGVHSRYIDGTVLEPGFELDELCAPVIALDYYISVTNDWDYLKKSYIQDGLDQIQKELKNHRHETEELYDTFLQPTDDPIVYPYLTYNNVLVWKVYQIMSRFASNEGDIEKTRMFSGLADEVEKGIYQHMVVKHKGKQMFAWSVDLEGNYNVYDEPPGSLQLLPHYGFCSSKDPIYHETVEHIRSDEYSYAFKGCEFEELGCEHADHPWVLSIANSFLAGRKEQAKDLILRTPMDGGIACESIDEHTGAPRTGEHFATCAGFLAYAIYLTFGQNKEGEGCLKRDTQVLES